MNEKLLKESAQLMVAPGKGLLAADESFGTIEKRFQALGIESTPETRRAYREMLFTTPNCEKSLSGIILFDETLRDSTSTGVPFPKLLADKGILPGIKVDEGAKEMALFPNEKVTEGLDGLRERLQEYAGLGARFAKWRAVITIGQGIPTKACLHANAHALARYAALCQEAGIVPVVEPEVIMDGDHTIEQCREATEAAQRLTFAALVDQGVMLEGMLLKPNMVLPGKDGPQVEVQEVAALTLQTLRRTVPGAVAGIVFLSGGQDDLAATARLNAMNSTGEPLPWQVSFSFARALQDEAMKLWKGEPGNVTAAQNAFAHRLQMNSAARSGKYHPELEIR